MFGMGMPEIILILVVALIVIGPKKFPDLAKSLGRAIGEFKKAAGDFKDSMDVDNEIGDVRQTFDDISDDVKGVIDVHADRNSNHKSDDTSPSSANEEGGADPDLKPDAESAPKEDTQKEKDDSGRGSKDA